LVDQIVELEFYEDYMLEQNAAIEEVARVEQVGQNEELGVVN
jgi:hypothetical protein